jgi:hypothetical protein
MKLSQCGRLCGLHLEIHHLSTVHVTGIANRRGELAVSPVAVVSRQVPWPVAVQGFSFEGAATATLGVGCRLGQRLGR